VQVELDVAPCCEEYEPAGHALHEEEPLTEENVPGAHNLHVALALLAPVELENVPALHSVQNVDAEIEEYVPAAQLRHPVLLANPAAVEYFPGTQGVQITEASA
jgi:hypothetical protein